MSEPAFRDMFGTHEVTELTRHDLARVVDISFVTFGSAQWASNGLPRMLAAFTAIFEQAVAEHNHRALYPV